MGADRKTWRNIPLNVAEKTKRKAYALDARNYGESEYTDEFSLSLTVDDLFHFMDTENIEKAVLFGHSMGSYTVLNAALRKPERVELAMSEDTFLRPINEKESSFYAEYAGKLASYAKSIPSSVATIEEAAKMVADKIFDNLPEEYKKGVSKDRFYKLYIPIKRDQSGQYTTTFNADVICKAFQDHDRVRIEPVGVYEGPVVFLSGTQSYIGLKEQESHIRSHLPNSEFIVIKEATHNIHAEFPDKIVDAIVEALSKYNAA